MCNVCDAVYHVGIGPVSHRPNVQCLWCSIPCWHSTLLLSHPPLFAVTEKTHHACTLSPSDLNPVGYILSSTPTAFVRSLPPCTPNSLKPPSASPSPPPPFTSCQQTPDTPHPPLYNPPQCHHPFMSCQLTFDGQPPPTPQPAFKAPLMSCQQTLDGPHAPHQLSTPHLMSCQLTSDGSGIDPFHKGSVQLCRLVHL